MQPDALPKHLLRALEQFEIPGRVSSVESLKTGHINETFVATWEESGRRVRYLHQRINRGVFHDPEGVMENVLRVTAHIQSKLEASKSADWARKCLTVVPSRGKKAWVKDEKGECWRTFLFIEGARSLESTENPSQAFEAGRAFGEFQRQLVDLPGRRLVETIPFFHDTTLRFNALQEAIAGDRYNRAAEAKAEIEFALKREAITGKILDLMAKGEIPERITHNDTKFNNLLLDATTGKALCVVDLDTVMPGCALYDFGDLVRTTTSPARENERDLSKVRMQMPMFEKLVEGYLSTAGEFLNETERELLAFSGKLITFETGIRFLTDYLCGDTYFRIERPGQNLDRCRTQFRLVESIEEQERAMAEFVRRGPKSEVRSPK
jgi:hypothetical protein